MARLLPDWISGFTEYSEGTESPRLFRKWAAVGVVAAALQRRTNVRTRTGPIYPNDFILLVSRPGVGKTNAVNLAEHFLRKLKVNILPTAVTKEQLYNEMQAKADRRPDPVHQILTTCAAVALPDELGVFIRHKDFDFMQDLIKLYDCIKLFIYATKNAGVNRLENVALTILGGTQPETLRKILPPEAFGMGFAARLILVYSNERIKLGVFSGGEMDAAVENMLTQDLKEISELSGKYVFEDKASELIEHWYVGGMKPEPSDRRLESYNQRRLLHLLKLCMIHAAARHNDLIIGLKDVQDAVELMLVTEQDMALCFQSMGEGNAITQLENVYSFILGEFAKGGNKGVEEHIVRDALLREMPIYTLRAAFNELSLAGWVRFVGEVEGNRLVYPTRKQMVK